MRWFLLALALVVGAVQSREEPPKPKPAANKSDAEQRGTEQAPIFVKTPGPSTDAERDYETYEKHQKPWNETATAYATIALGVITLALAIFTGFLWNATRKLVSEAKDTAKKELRAYLGVKRAYFGIHRYQTNVSFVAHLTIANSGQTTADKVRLALHVGFTDDPATQQFPITFRPGTTYLVAGSEWNLHMPMVKEIADALAAKLATAYIWGRIEYVDAFGVDRHSAFRFSSDVINIDRSGETVGWDVYPEPEGNEAT